MKIVLSRKGFDSSAGGHASPVLPDGTMVSLPIPSALDRLPYAAIVSGAGCSYGELIEELDARGRIEGMGAHLDPDLVASARPRRRGWSASLGQIDAAAGHLRNHGVGVGDLFLFYGWFRHTERIAGRLRWASDPGFHALFGYLQIGAVIAAGPATTLPAWLADHPHAHPIRRARSTNTIYVAADGLADAAELPGAATFGFDESLVLTRPGAARSRWRLDRTLFGDARISYHDARAWRADYFQSCARGQEYVIDADDRIIGWAHALIRDASSRAARSRADRRARPPGVGSSSKQRGRIRRERDDRT